jgi:hypothetical protein
MAHKLVIIAAIGLTASAACIGAAAAIGGKNFGDGLDFSLFDNKPRCEVLAGSAAGARDFDWDGSDHFGLAVQGTASYAPTGPARMHVTGDPQVLAHLRLRDGTLEMDCSGWRDRTQDLAITLPGRSFRKFSIFGGGNLALDRLDQDEAKIEIDGAGHVKANGRIGTFKMTINGSGDGDFDQLASRQAEADIHGSGTIRGKGKIDDVKIRIDGSGDADFGQAQTQTANVGINGHGDVHIAPTEQAKVEINGSGDVYLHSDPKTLDTQMHGSGRIHRMGSGT